MDGGRFIEETVQSIRAQLDAVARTRAERNRDLDETETRLLAALSALEGPSTRGEHVVPMPSSVPRPLPELVSEPENDDGHTIRAALAALRRLPAEGATTRAIWIRMAASGFKSDAIDKVAALRRALNREAAKGPVARIQKRGDLWRLIER